MKLKKQFTTLLPWIILIHGPIIAMLVYIETQEAIPAAFLLRDPNSLGDLPFYAGSVSNAGALLWVATAVICLFILGPTQNSLPCHPTYQDWLG